MCLMEAEGAPKLMPACATPIRDGMVVRTDTERVQQAVRYAMEFLLLHHPIDCPVCDQSGECWLQDYYMEHGEHDSRYAVGEKTRRMKAFDMGPTVKLDQERCILCTRCVRFTRDVTKTNELQVFGRGHKSKIDVYQDKPLENPYSINVVDVCPVGALTSTDFRFKVRSWFLKGTPSICGGCSTGCNLRIDHSARPQGGGIPGYSATDGVVYRTVGRRNTEVNRSWLCDEGRLSFHTLEKWPRLTESLVGGAVFGIEDALQEAHSRFEAIREAHGESALAGLGTAISTNEALYLMKQYFRGQVDFRLADETTLYETPQDDMLRRHDKHPNTRGALDLGLDTELGGLDGLVRRAEEKAVRAVWIAFHPQLVDADPEEIAAKLARILENTEFSVVSAPHDFEWARKASILLPMAAWSEETGTYTNYAGRVQIANCGIKTTGSIWPLHRLMASMLRLAGEEVGDDPAAIFEAIARDVPLYAELDYETIGALGTLPPGRVRHRAEGVPEEVMG